MNPKLISDLKTRHHSASFYLTWFLRCFDRSDSGWHCSRTPDDHGIMFQDAFFWRSLEIIASTLNEMMAEEQKKVANKGTSKRGK